MSRLERGELSPSVATLQRILFVLGETLELDAVPMVGDHDAAHLADLLARTPAERLELAIGWNRLAGEIAAAGRRARGSVMTRLEIPLDAARILQGLFERGVAYTVIGGLAVQAHGHTRTTQDVDLVPDPDPENLTRLALALDALGAREAGQGSRLDADALQSRFLGGNVVTLDTDAGGVDVHLRPLGAPPYSDLAARALVLDVVGVTVSIAGRDDLIAMKRASGQPIDRGDVIALTAPERSDEER